ncbi:MAG: glycosyltransferase [Candidatus Omnitrophica bacterium]|nr:glycosyltransferase [Candidatus Omnitrophota bacterium]
MQAEFPFISIVIPVRNEASVLARCLESLGKLDYPKDRYEIIIADGLSTDRSAEIARSFGAIVISNEGLTATTGRNSGFACAQGDIVAFTDADCVFDPGWLKNSLKYLGDPRVAGVSGPTRFPPDSSHFEAAVNLIFNMVAKTHYTVHMQELNRPREIHDIPGCNALYKKEALEKVMPLDENLLTAEDVWVNYLLRNAGYRLLLTPDIIVWHYRRSSPKKFIRQMYRYAIARCQVGKKSSLQLLRPLHIVIAVLPVLFLIGLTVACAFGLLSTMIKTALIIIFIITGALLVKTANVAVALYTILAAFILVCSWSAGFLREWFFPLRVKKTGDQ